MTLYIVKVDGHPRTYRTMKHALWALTFFRGWRPNAWITFKRIHLPAFK